jgi:endonuclease-3 related protein
MFRIFDRGITIFSTKARGFSCRAGVKKVEFYLCAMLRSCYNLKVFMSAADLLDTSTLKNCIAEMTQEKLTGIYNRLFHHFGPQAWWPGDTPFEVMVGAVLTQNTNWKNVERAIDNLKRAGVLSFERLSGLPVDLLAEYIRPAGYFNVKAGRLQNLMVRIEEQYGGSLDAMMEEETEALRQKLLSVKGIGPETADSILLYAAQRPVFVVDTYTYRILLRHDLIPEDFGYDDIQQLFMDNLEPDTGLYNEFHALLVCAGKEFCKKTAPRCAGCPLEGV